MQILALDEFHNHRDSVVNLERRVEARYMHMRQAGENPYLTQEALRDLVPAAVGAQEFHRLCALRDDVADFVHLPNTARPKLAQYFVVAYVLARLHRHGCYLNGSSSSMDWVFFRPHLLLSLCLLVAKIANQRQPLGPHALRSLSPSETAVSERYALLLLPQSRAARGYHVSPAAAGSGLAGFVL